jgi:hypothetical protein
MNSCSVTKCRYSNGWNLGLGKGVEYPGVQVAKSNKAVSRKAAKNFNDSLVKEAFANILKSDSAVSNVDNNSFFTAPNYSAHKVQIGHQPIGKDSLKNADKYKKKKSKARHRYQSNIYDFIPDNEYEYLAFVFLLGFIIVIAIIWAIYSLIRLIVKALRKDKDLLPDNSTVSPKSNDSITAADPNQKGNGVEQETTFEGDTVSDHSNEMAENTEETADLEDDNKTKLQNFLLVVAVVFVLLGLTIFFPSPH